MKFIILRKIKFKETDLQLYCLNEDGNIIQIYFPGILKSTKRNSYFLQPGCIWDFTLSRIKPLNNNIPTEYQLITSPFDEKISYKKLDQLSELISPTRFLVQGDSHLDIFPILEKILKVWQELDANESQWLINSFYIFILKNMGLFSEGQICNNCEKTITKDDFYILNEGNLCRNCSTGFPSRLPYAFFNYYINRFNPWVKSIDDISSFSKHLGFDFQTAIRSDTFKNSMKITKMIDQYINEAI